MHRPTVRQIVKQNIKTNTNGNSVTPSSQYLIVTIFQRELARCPIEMLNAMMHIHFVGYLSPFTNVNQWIFILFKIKV